MGATLSVLSVLSSVRHPYVPTAERVQYIRNSPFFLYIPDIVISEFAKCFPSARLLREGQTLELKENSIYILAKGELKLSAILPSNNKAQAKGYLCTKRPGDILDKNQLRRDAVKRVTAAKLGRLVDDVDITCCEEGTLLLCSNQISMESFTKKYPDVAKSINIILKTQIKDLLVKLPFLSEVKDTQMNVLAAMARYMSLDSDQVVFEENSFGNKLYFLLNGEAGVFHNYLAPKSITTLHRSIELANIRRDSVYDDNGLKLVAKVKPGEYFGEMALMVNIPRTTTVKTLKKCLFLTFEKTDFDNFLKVCPIKASMMKVIKERLVSKLSILDIPFMEGIPAEKHSYLLSLSRLYELEKGDVIFREGEAGDSFYIILYGEVKLEKNEKETDDTGEATTTELGTLGPGFYFGEMALVNDSPRTATAVVMEKVLLLSLSKESFNSIFDFNSQGFAEFNLRLLHNDSDLQHWLTHDSAIRVLRKYLRESYAEENLDFWIQAKALKDSKDGTNEELLAKSKEVFEEFCEEGSSRQVNLSSTQREEIKKCLYSGPFHRNVFDNSIEEIHSLLLRDSFTRFKKSSDFEDFFNGLGMSTRNLKA